RLKALSLKLTTSGYDVSTATDASEAIAAVRDTRPDLFLLDIDFPPDLAMGGGWDGLKIMRWLRGLSPVLHAPFVILSGCDPKQYAPEAYAGGAIAFLEKPVDSRELLQVIRSTLERRTAPSSPAPLLVAST
ncbi:MAG TPA: response regulator, partial [Clostridia bacterium]|nr:response regulator [Clostridia bacterium]